MPRTTSPLPDAAAIFRAVLGESSLPMAATQGQDHLVRYANPAFCLLVARSEAEILGLPLPAVLGETEIGDTSALLAGVFRSGGAASVAVFRGGGVHPALHATYAAWRVPPERSRPTGLLVQVIDTSDHARAQALAAQAAAELSEVNRLLLQAGLDAEVRAETHVTLNAALRQTEARLNVALRQAEAAVKMRDQIMAALAHDLKGPLTTISMHAQVAARDSRRLRPPVAAGTPSAAGTPASPGLPEDIAERVEAGLRRIQADAQKMARWIDQLIDVTRLGLGEAAPLHRRPVDLVRLVERMATGLRQGMDAAAAERLRVQPAVQSLIGEWDEARLERVLENLMGNALKYSPQGGEVTVTVALEPRTPREPSSSTHGAKTGHGEGEQAVLRVSDLGVGIPAAELSAVFEPFHRAGNVAETFPGTGIGLASVRQIVERHGGTVSVESVEGKGSTFTVRLPLD